MSIIDKLFAIIAPHSCIQCGTEGSVFCKACQGSLVSSPSICYQCGNSSADFRTCEACSVVSQVFCVTIYKGTARNLVHRFKTAGGRAAAAPMARLMNQAIQESDATLLVPIPTATSHVRERGYDHTLLLANALQQESGLMVSRCLVRYGQSRQAGATRRQRLLRMTDMFGVSNKHLVAGKSVILIDDVVTTGASLEAAAQRLLAAGATKVSAVVFARTPPQH